MSRNLADRPGLVVFLGGVACLVTSVALGFYLTHETASKLAQSGRHVEWWQDTVGETAEVRANRALLSNVNALMWMVFGLGTCLTLVGMRLRTRPDLDFVPSKPLGSIRDVFEDPV